MVGGAYYKGHKLTVSASTGDYTLDMTLSDRACAANGISVTPDTYGAGDHFKLEHLDSSNNVKALLASTIYNIGKSVTIIFDFPSLELLDAGHKMRLTYTNVAGTSMSVYTVLERLTTKSGGA
jgi:hypothetical protein